MSTSPLCRFALAIALVSAAPSAFADDAVPTAPVHKDQALKMATGSTVSMAPPTCQLASELGKDRAAETSVKLLMTTTGTVARALLDTIEITPPNGERLVYPYRNPPKGNAWATYLASAVGPGGIGICTINISVTDAPVTQPPGCTVTPAEKIIKAGESVDVMVNVTGTATAVSLQGKTEDPAKRAWTVTPTQSGPMTFVVTGQGGQSACAAFFLVTPNQP